MKRVGVIALLMAVLLTTVAAAETLPSETPAAEMTAEAPVIYYVYDNPCASCAMYAKFVETMNATTNALGISPILVREVYLPDAQDRALYAQLCLTYAVPEDGRVLPMMIAENGVLMGEKAIEEGLVSLLIKDFIYVDAVYFYRDDCPDCMAVADAVAALPETLNMARLDTNIPANKECIYQVFDAYQLAREDQEIPFIYTPQGVFPGQDDVLAWCAEQTADTVPGQEETK